MSEPDEIDRFAKDPSLLAQLWREVIDRLDSGADDSDIGEQETQLREIAKAIERLEMEWRDSTREYAWQSNAQWERYRMVQDGTLCSDSPRGTWELRGDKE